MQKVQQKCASELHMPMACAVFILVVSAYMGVDLNQTQCGAGGDLQQHTVL